MKLRVYDIDGTILSSQHRYKLHDDLPKRIDLDHWRINSTPSQIMQDRPIFPLLNRLLADQRNADIVTAISTNRYICDHTLQVFEKYGINPDFVSSRTHDQQKGSELKQEFILNLFSLLQPEQVIFIDDNVKVLQDVKNHFILAGLGSVIRCIYQPSKQGY